MNTPKHIFFFLVVLGLSVLGLSFLSPSQKVAMGPFELGYYQPSDLLGQLWTAKAPIKQMATEEDSMVFDFDEDLDGAIVVDEEPLEVVEQVELDTNIQIIDVLRMAPYFEGLKALKAGQKSRVRVIHYGDSQLEGDRITAQLRDGLQRAYGGKGFGWVALSPLVAPAPLDFQEVEGAARKTLFGRRDTAIKDGKYGHLATFTALMPTDSAGYAASVKLKRRSWGYARARGFRTVRMASEGEQPLVVEVFAGDTLFSTRIIPVGAWTMALEVPAAEEMELKFKSAGPARVYGLTFESPTGVQVDNVAMRGASGMMFTKLDPEQFGQFLAQESYSLIIMQFGGNTVPYLKDEAHAKRVARSMARQIDAVKRAYAGAAILYIGPSDMARKNGLKMESYPLIKVLKDALRKEVLSRGAAYWDLYDVMGGEGSMVRWVDHEPAFAVKDYIHFTPYGAKKVGNSLFGALNELGTRYEAKLAEIAAREAEVRDSLTRFKQATGVQQATGATP